MSARVSSTGGFQVSWEGPSDDGGAAITGYTATAVLRSALEPRSRLVRAADDTLFTCSSDTASCFMPAPGTIYDYAFTVIAGNMAGVSEPSEAFEPVKPVVPPNPSPGTPPSPPGNVRAVPGDGEVTVSWTPPTQVGDYPVSDYEAQAQPGGATCLVKAPALTCTITGLDNGTAYTFIVRALSGAGWGTWSKPSPAVTPSPVAKRRPSKPLKVRVRMLGDGKVLVTWRPPADAGSAPIQRYIIGYRAIGQFRYVSLRAGPQARSIKITGLKPGMRYGIRVRAANAAGSGDGALVMIRVR